TQLTFQLVAIKITRDLWPAVVKRGCLSRIHDWSSLSQPISFDLGIQRRAFQSEYARGFVLRTRSVFQSTLDQTHLKLANLSVEIEAVLDRGNCRLIERLHCRRQLRDQTTQRIDSIVQHPLRVQTSLDRGVLIRDRFITRIKHPTFIVSDNFKILTHAEMPPSLFPSKTFVNFQCTAGCPACGDCGEASPQTRQSAVQASCALDCEPGQTRRRRGKQP